MTVRSAVVTWSLVGINLLWQTGFDRPRASLHPHDHVRGLDHRDHIASGLEPKLTDCLNRDRGDEAHAGDVELDVRDRLPAADRDDPSGALRTDGAPLS